MKPSSKTLALILLLVAFMATAAHAQVGSLVSSVTFSKDCISSVGTGITFDGTYLWYSCYGSSAEPTDLHRADPLTGAVSASYSFAAGLGSLAYDATRNVIYAGPGKSFTDPEIPARMRVIQLDANHNAIGATTLFTFDPADPNYTCGLGDGIAFDAGNLADPTDDSIYFSCHLSPIIARYSLAGVAQEAPFFSSGAGCVSSGLAIGGNALFEATDACNHVWAVDKTSKAPLFDFSTLVASDSNPRGEGLTCDTKTFFPSLGKHVIWSKEAYNPMRAYAFEIPLNTCGFGGNPPPNDGLACPLGHGFWKNHAAKWPVDQLMLGGRSYSATQLLLILSLPVRGDASLILADQLIAAKLNIINGSDNAPILTDLANADSYLALAGVLPAGIKTSTAAGKLMTKTAEHLDQYNNDVLTPTCKAKVP